MSEIWKDIPGFEGLYQVSNLGRVKSLPRQRKGRGKGFRTTPEKVLTPIRVGDYLGVQLCDLERVEKRYVHRLVAQSFLENMEGKREVNHIDGNKHNNMVTNLEWCSHSENGIHAFRTGLRRHIPRNKKPVVLYDGKGYKRLFDSIADAASFLGVAQSGVSRACSISTRRVCGLKAEYYESVQ